MYDLGNRLRIVNIVLQNINRHYFKKAISMIDYFPLDYSLVSLIRPYPTGSDSGCLSRIIEFACWNLPQYDRFRQLTVVESVRIQ
jgi:hypothetical protein